MDTHYGPQVNRRREGDRLGVIMPGEKATIVEENDEGQLVIRGMVDLPTYIGARRARTTRRVFTGAGLLAMLSLYVRYAAPTLGNIGNAIDRTFEMVRLPDEEIMNDAGLGLSDETNREFRQAYAEYTSLRSAMQRVGDTANQLEKEVTEGLHALGFKAIEETETYQKGLGLHTRLRNLLHGRDTDSPAYKQGYERTLLLQQQFTHALDNILEPLKRADSSNRERADAKERFVGAWQIYGRFREVADDYENVTPLFAERTANELRGFTPSLRKKGFDYRTLFTVGGGAAALGFMHSYVLRPSGAVLEEKLKKPLTPKFTRREWLQKILKPYESTTKPAEAPPEQPAEKELAVEQSEVEPDAEGS